MWLRQPGFHGSYLGARHPMEIHLAATAVQSQNGNLPIRAGSVGDLPHICHICTHFFRMIFSLKFLKIVHPNWSSGIFNMAHSSFAWPFTKVVSVFTLKANNQVAHLADYYWHTWLMLFCIVSAATALHFWDEGSCHYWSHMTKYGQNGHLWPYATNSNKKGVPEKNYKNVAQQC